MRSRAWNAILSMAFFSVESAVIIALSIILFGLGFAPFEWWQSWYWLVFGALAEAVYLGVSVTDPKAAQRAVDRMLTQRYDPGTIRNPLARERLKRALEYRRMIGEAATNHTGAMRRSIEHTAIEIDDWIEQIYLLARRMDSFEENDLIGRDRRMVPHDLKTLRRRLEAEQSPEVRAELEERQKRDAARQPAQPGKQHQASGHPARPYLAALGTVYAQLQLIDSRTWTARVALRRDSRRVMYKTPSPRLTRCRASTTPRAAKP